MDREGSSLFQENGSAGFLLQPLKDRLLRDGLAVTGAHQLASGTLGGHVKRFRSSGVPLPWDAGHQLKQLLKGTAFPLHQHQIDPVAEAEGQICPVSVQNGAFEAYEAVFRNDGFHSQPLQLPGNRAFQPESGGGSQGKGSP